MEMQHDDGRLLYFVMMMSSAFFRDCLRKEFQVCSREVFVNFVDGKVYYVEKIESETSLHTRDKVSLNVLRLS